MEQKLQNFVNLLTFNIFLCRAWEIPLENPNGFLQTQKQQQKDYKSSLRFLNTILFCCFVQN